jgi:hypothetical protein
LVGGGALAADRTPQLYVPDGQLLSHVFRVFATDEITSEMEPRLLLEASHIFLEPDPKEKRAWEGRVIPHQYWQDTVDGQTVQLEGTLLLFDLRDYPIHLLKPAIRVIPTLTWKDPVRRGGEQRMLVGRNAVYLAHLGHALVLTLVLLGLVLFMISVWAKRKSPQKKAIITEARLVWGTFGSVRVSSPYGVAMCVWRR